MKLDLNFKANLKDKTTTFLGIVLFVLGITFSIAPFFLTQIQSEIYTVIVEYAKYLCVTLIFSGLILIGAIRKEVNNNEHNN
jgi:hypothetical protein